MCHWVPSKAIPCGPTPPTVIGNEFVWLNPAWASCQAVVNSAMLHTQRIVDARRCEFISCLPVNGPNENTNRLEHLPLLGRHPLRSISGGLSQHPRNQGKSDRAIG